MRRPQPPRFVVALVVVLVCSTLIAGRVLSAQGAQFQLASQDASAQLRTFNVNGPVDTNNPFFQDLGANGRACSRCHQPDQGWTITPERVQERFDHTQGLDPIFRTNDGSNCENADVSTLANRQNAFSLLLNRGLIRVGIGVPAAAEFSVVDIDDPYDCPASHTLPLAAASMYRRPLPSTNLQFLTAVMWDGREGALPATSGDLHAFLSQQSLDATNGHAQASVPLTTAQRDQIVAFETGLFTAQAHDDAAGELNAEGAAGGPKALASQPFFVGINDVVSPGFNSSVLSIFSAWASIEGNGPVADTRRSIARGEQIFNTKTFVIDGVGGFPATQPFAAGTCTVCHDTPNVGNHSVKAPLNIGLTDESRRTPDMPLYTLRNAATGATVKTTDPGRAMITGKWADVGKFKGPIFRGLAGRAPYFHNGSARTLADVVSFYQTRFGMSLTAQEKKDLVAFLRSL